MRRAVRWLARCRRTFIRGSGRAARAPQSGATNSGMRILLIPLLLAVAVVLTAVLLATPPKAGGAVGPATQHRDRKN